MDTLRSISDLLPLLLQGAGATIRVAAAAMLVAIAVSFAIGLARRSTHAPLRLAAFLYTEFFRGTSVLVQLFFLYFILPLYGVRLSAEVTGILGLGLNLGAYGSEIVRSALESISRGQYEAAYSLALPRWVVFRYIVLPQALTIMLPSFGNLAIEMVKTSALVSLITISELTYVGQNLVTATGRSVAVWGLVFLGYLIINLPINLFVLWAERKFGKYKEAGRGV